MNAPRQERGAELVKLMVEHPAEFTARYRWIAGIDIAAPLSSGKTAVEMIRNVLEVDSRTSKAALLTDSRNKSVV